MVDQTCGVAPTADPGNTQGGAGADPSQGRTDCGWRVRKVFPASRGQSVQALRALPDYGAQAVSPTQGGQGQNGTGAMTVWCANRVPTHDVFQRRMRAVTNQREVPMLNLTLADVVNFNLGNAPKLDADAVAEPEHVHALRLLDAVVKAADKGDVTAIRLLHDLGLLTLPPYSLDRFDPLLFGKSKTIGEIAEEQNDGNSDS